MFEWITKPFIEWNIIDRILCYAEVGIGSFAIILLSLSILDLRDKIKDKKRLKK